jgi:hypothetical protein
MVLMRSGVASESLIAATSTPVSLISVKASVRSARVPDENAVLEAVARRQICNALDCLHHMYIIQEYMFQML